jgi:hypothetical protein
MLPSQDDYPSISISRMRALGQVTADMTRVCVTIAGLTREVRVTHRKFPNGGSWSFFLCPSCGRRARVLRLYEKLACWRCAGLLYRCQQGDKTARIERLKKLLYGEPARLHPRPRRTLDRRSRLEVSLRRALIVERRRAVRGFPSARCPEVQIELRKGCVHPYSVKVGSGKLERLGHSLTLFPHPIAKLLI